MKVESLILAPHKQARISIHIISGYFQPGPLSARMHRRWAGIAHHPFRPPHSDAPSRQARTMDSRLWRWLATCHPLPACIRNARSTRRVPAALIPGNCFPPCFEGRIIDSGSTQTGAYFNPHYIRIFPTGAFVRAYAPDDGRHDNSPPPPRRSPGSIGRGAVRKLS